MNSPIYLYKLNENTGEISVYEITEWILIPHKFGIIDRDEFRFTGKFGSKFNYTYNVRRNKLDKYISQKVFSFTYNPQEIYKIIKTAIEDKRLKAVREASKQTSILRKMEENHGFFTGDKIR